MRDGFPEIAGCHFATHREYGWRSLVQIGRDGIGHLRAYTPRGSSSFDPSAFKDYSRRITDPAERRKGKQVLCSK
jgi:hypothetical protein